jgi:tRNA(fMet)-specific endonuclease VapC
MIRKKPLPILHRLEKLHFGDAGISAITFSELNFGVENSADPETNRQRLLEFVAPLEILDYPSDAAQAYGRLRAALSKKGLGIGSLDLLIAAHAIYLGVTLVTNNTKEFSRIANLKIENWMHS